MTYTNFQEFAYEFNHASYAAPAFLAGAQTLGHSENENERQKTRRNYRERPSDQARYESCTPVREEVNIQVVEGTHRFASSLPREVVSYRQGPPGTHSNPSYSSYRTGSGNSRVRPDRPRSYPLRSPVTYGITYCECRRPDWRSKRERADAGNAILSGCT